MLLCYYGAGVLLVWHYATMLLCYYGHAEVGVVGDVVVLTYVGDGGGRGCNRNATSQCTEISDTRAARVARAARAVRVAAPFCYAVGIMPYLTYS